MGGGGELREEAGVGGGGCKGQLHKFTINRKQS